ncbi:hypothetical protein [Sinosporangium siamense]|uniref:Uncharacterized protein n=1 Tax=Sinosporangium siamense TaxID=1367973 RepID=A0A919RM85_9ACTN|nr:hypothetical protein [Sinosporangium siamense]GII94569.1 hypothetical protein Ssi02_48000 [Sinosporangium siamense]
MRRILLALALLMVLSGISGVLDQIAVQPFLGIVLNAFNRLVVNQVDFLAGYEVFANLALALAGGVVALAAQRVR